MTDDDTSHPWPLMCVAPGEYVPLILASRESHRPMPQSETPKSIDGIEPVIISGWICERSVTPDDDELVVFIQDKKDYIEYDDEPFTKRLKEHNDSFVTIRYWISDKELTIEELKQLALEEVFGGMNANFDVIYTEETGDCYMNNDAHVGGRDLVEEIRSRMGMYLYMEIYVHKKDIVLFL